MAIDMAQFHEMYFDECEEYCSRAAGLLGAPVGGHSDVTAVASALECVRHIKDGAQVFGFARLVELAIAIEVSMGSFARGAASLDSGALSVLREQLTELRGRIHLQRAAGDVRHRDMREKGNSIRVALIDESSQESVPGRYLTFSLGDGLYAVAAELVLEVRDGADVEPIADDPDGICGMTRLGEAHIPVIDLGVCVGRTHRLGGDDFLTQLIVSVGGRVCSLLIDAAEQVVTLPAATRVLPVSDEWESIRGVVMVGGRRVKLIDSVRLMHSFDRERSLSECAAG